MRYLYVRKNSYIYSKFVFIALQMCRTCNVPHVLYNNMVTKRTFLQIHVYPSSHFSETNYEQVYIL